MACKLARRGMLPAQARGRHSIWPARQFGPISSIGLGCSGANLRQRECKHKHTHKHKHKHTNTHTQWPVAVLVFRFKKAAHLLIGWQTMTQRAKNHSPRAKRWQAGWRLACYARCVLLWACARPSLMIDRRPVGRLARSGSWQLVALAGARVKADKCS